MRVRTILAAGAVLAVPHLALADLPVSKEMLGRVEAIVTFCSKVKPDAAASYWQPVKSLVAGIPAEQIDEVRSSPEYQDTFELTRSSLEKGDREQALRACTSL